MTRRRGVSPVLSTVILILLAVGMAAGAYTFLSQGKERVAGETQRLELETVNLTCMPDRVTWWINNTGENSASGTADFFVYGDTGLNSSLTRTGMPVSGGFTRARGSGTFEISPLKSMVLGKQYSLELAFVNGNLKSSCRVGDGWWDADWDYRRALKLDTASDVTAQLVLDAESLVGEGKLRSDCADLRGVENGEVVPYSVTFCNPDGTARLRVNLSGARPGEAYIYYGNLQAGSAEQPLQNEGIVHPELGPEERLNLP